MAARMEKRMSGTIMNLSRRVTCNSVAIIAVVSSAVVDDCRNRRIPHKRV